MSFGQASLFGHLCNKDSALEFKNLANGVKDSNKSFKLPSVSQKKWKAVRVYWREHQAIIAGLRIPKE